MSIVQPWLPEARVLDLFAGSGALGLEALSRGARSADFVENDPRAFRVLSENITRVGAEVAATLHRTDALRFAAALGELEYDIAFADPPYDAGGAQRLAELWLSTPFARVLGIEHDPKQPLPGAPAIRRYGSTAIAFYQHD
jgi:16S rRNA (guanine966-N2)-methyltransferase